MFSAIANLGGAEKKKKRRSKTQPGSHSQKAQMFRQTEVVKRGELQIPTS